MGRTAKWSLLSILTALAIWGIAVTLIVYKPFTRQGPANPANAAATAPGAQTTPATQVLSAAPAIHRVGNLPAYRAGAAPLYRGRGLITIEFPSTNDPVTNERLLHVDDYLNSQAMMLTSRTIITLAMESKKFAETGLPTDETTYKTIAENLVIEHPVRTEVFCVYFFDKDPKIARQIVRCIIDAYVDYIQSRTQPEDNTRRRLLDNRRLMLKANDDRLQAKLFELTVRNGTKLDAKIDSAMQEESRLKTLLTDADLQFQAAQHAAKLNGAAQPVDPAALELAKRRVEDVGKKYEEAKDARAEMVRQLALQQDLARQLEELNKERQDISMRLDTLAKELQNGRVRIIEEGDVPPTHWKPE